MTSEFDHMEVTGDPDKDRFIGKVGLKAGYSGEFGKKKERENGRYNQR